MSFNNLIILEFVVCGAVKFNWIILNVQLLTLIIIKYDFFFLLVLHKHLCSRWELTEIISCSDIK